ILTLQAQRQRHARPAANFQHLLPTRWSDKPDGPAIALQVRAAPRQYPTDNAAQKPARPLELRNDRVAQAHGAASAFSRSSIEAASRLSTAVARSTSRSSNAAAICSTIGVSRARILAKTRLPF